MPDIKGNNKKIYDFLSSQGVQGIGGDSDQFQSFMEKDDNRRKVYDYLSSVKAQGIGDSYDAFSSMVYAAPDTNKNSQWAVTPSPYWAGSAKQKQEEKPAEQPQNQPAPASQKAFAGTLGDLGPSGGPGDPGVLRKPEENPFPYSGGLEEEIEEIAKLRESVAEDAAFVKEYEERRSKSTGKNQVRMGAGGFASYRTSDNDQWLRENADRYKQAKANVAKVERTATGTENAVAAAETKIAQRKNREEMASPQEIIATGKTAFGRDNAGRTDSEHELRKAADELYASADKEYDKSSKYQEGYEGDALEQLWTGVKDFVADAGNNFDSGSLTFGLSKGHALAKAREVGDKYNDVINSALKDMGMSDGDIKNALSSIEENGAKLQTLEKELNASSAEIDAMSDTYEDMVKRGDPDAEAYGRQLQKKVDAYNKRINEEYKPTWDAYDGARKTYEDVMAGIDAAVESGLTGGEKALLDALEKFTQAKTLRSDDVSVAGKAGAGAEQSAEFMLDFILTGGISKAGTKVATKIATNRALKKFGADALKEMARLGKTVKPGLGLRLGTDVVTSLARTGVMAPRTIQSYGENLTEYSGKDEAGRIEFDRSQANALGNSLLTQYIEYWSEGFGEYFGEAEQALFRSITKNAPKAAIGQTLKGYRGSIGQYLDKGKFDGMFNEMLEEVVGSTFNALAGWMSGDRVGDAGAMKEFFAGENLATLALSFLPMSAIGAATNVSAYHKMKERYDRGVETMDRFVKSGAISHEELQQLTKDIPNLSPAEVKDKIVDITDRARKANGGRLPSDFTQNLLGYIEGEFAMGLRYDEWEDSQEKMSVVNAYTASYTNPDARAAWDLNDNEQTARQAALESGFTEEELDNDSYMLAQEAFEIKGTEPERSDALMNYASAKAAAEGLQRGYAEQTQQVSEIFDERVRRNLDTNGSVVTAQITLNGKPTTVFITQEDASVDANGNLTTPTGPAGVVTYRLNEADPREGEKPRTAPASQFSNVQSTDTTQFIDEWQNNFQQQRQAYYESAQNTVSPTGQAREISEKVGHNVIVSDGNGVYQPFTVERMTNGGNTVVLSGDKKALQGVAEAMGIRVPTSGYLEAPVSRLYPLLAKEEDGSLSTGLGEKPKQEEAPAAPAQEAAPAAEENANVEDLRDRTVQISIGDRVQDAHVISTDEGRIRFELLDENGDVTRTTSLPEAQFTLAMQAAQAPAPAAESKQTQAVKPMDAKDFDIDSIDFDNNYVILHQTGTQNFDSILQNGLRVGNGLNGTTTIANRGTLASILQAQTEGRGHEGSDGLVIMQIPKSWANGRDIRNLDQLDDILTERFGDSAIQTVPTDIITHAIATPKESSKASIPVDEKTGEKIYDAPGVEVADAIADIYATEGLTEADVDQYIAKRAAETEAARNPEMGSMSPQAWGQAKQEAARVADFWQAMRRASEQRKAQQEEAIEEAVEEATPVETAEAPAAQPAAEPKQRIAPAPTPMTVEPRRKVVAKLKNWGRRTGVKVNIIRSVDEVKDATARKALKEGRALTGWFNDKTGEVDVFLPNVMNAVEADKTFIHETVAHKGLRGLLGEEGYNELCDRVWNELMTPEEQAEFMEYNRHLQGSDEYLRRAAADEYIARLSENMDMQDNRNIFEKIIDWVMDLLGLGGNVSGIEKGAAEKATAEGSITRSDLYDLLEDSLKRFEKGRKKLNTESLPTEIQNEMQAKGLVMEGGAVMDGQQAALKAETGYKTPNELDMESSPEVGNVRFSESTMPAWARNYMTYRDAKKHVVQVLENFVRDVAVDELVHGMVPTGVYNYGEKSSGSFDGPLRTNIEYIVTFDLDTSCPRSLQYLEYVKQIEAQIGRPLTQIESIQLIEMMRMYGQMIPCVYCYCENKRQALKQYYTDFMKARNGVINAKTEEEALAAMYGHNTTAEAQESNDPAVVLTPAAYEVFKRWRQEKDYNPTIEQLWFQYKNDRNVILTVLDDMLASGAVSTDMTDKKITNALCKNLGITGTAEKGTVGDIVSEWKWDCIEDRKHNDFTRIEDEDDLVFDHRTLALWREMTGYGKSASGAKNVLRYVPYTDELKTLSQEQRDFINGLGGLRMHSSNDFRIDYVLDYFQFMADMAVNKMFGHTYTKSPEFVRIFGNSGYKINMSIAAYEDSRGIRQNADEGFDWATARELREKFPNAGVMLMATSDAQIQFALDNDWVDMCIPFHHSGLPKAIWKEMRAWTDYTSTQNEKFLNATEMRAALKADGVPVSGKLSAEAVEKLYNDHFHIKVLRGKDGKRMRPHFLPGPTPKDGVIIPGHGNDYETYMRLCREYGVHPRFYGIKVKDNTPEGGGREVDITEHPGYMKFIKETARTDSPQTAIEFNFDQPSEALGGHSPIEYALEELKARAQSESEAAGGPVRNIYESYKQDPYGIVPQFINGILKHKEKLGVEELPLDYLTPDSRKWFMTERRALEDAYKDFDTIPYHPHEYDENGNLIMEGETPAEASADPQVSEGGGTMFRERTAPAPQKTEKVYKLMRLGEDGNLYPLFIDRDAQPIKLGTWYDADSPDMEFLKKMPSGVFLVDAQNGTYTSLEDYKKERGEKVTKLPGIADVEEAAKNGLRWMKITETENPQRRYEGENRKYENIGINGSEGVSTFAMRPGWHAGSLPTMRQIGKGSGKNLRDDNFVWVEGEIAADKDYNEEAQRNPDKDIPTHIPTDGFYMKATNANKKASQADRVGWYVAGAFKPNRIMSDSEATAVIDQWNAEHPDAPVEYDWPRESGKVFNAETMQLEDPDKGPDGGDGGGRTIESANEKQKQPLSEGVDLGLARLEEPTTLFRVSNNNRTTIESWLRKRTDISDAERNAVMDYIDGLDNAKLQLATARWYANGAIRLPEDMDKVKQAVSVAGKAKVDPLQYPSPMALLDTHADFKPTEERINPDNVSTLHRAAEYPDYGIVVYDVDGGEQSRKNMREIINTHFGKGASPWCLLQGDGEGNLTPDSKRYWRHYSAYTKQVAFKGGKLLAFSANDSATRLWWDRTDKSHYGIPVPKKIEGDPLGRSTNYIISEEIGGLEVEPGAHMFKGNRQNGVYEEWSVAGDQLLERTQYKDGKEEGICEAWFPSGQQQKRAVMKDDHFVAVKYWYDNGNPRVEATFNEKTYEPDGKRTMWWRNGNRQEETYFKDGSYTGERRKYDEDGNLWLIYTYDEEGDIVRIDDYNFYSYRRTGKIRRQDVRTQTDEVIQEPIPEQGQTMFRERITPEQDKEYMDAVEAGDMEKAQRMVDEAARAAGYAIKAYHGTETEDGERPFNVIKGGHFTDDWDFAEYYAASGNFGNAEPYVFNTYIKMENPFEYDFKGQNSDYAFDENGEIISTHTVFNRAKEEGYDGVILLNVDEYGGGVEADEYGEYPGTITDYIPATPGQVKSAEPVERDDNGNVIPLSERFNPENNDIRSREAPTEEQGEEVRIANAERQATDVTLDRMSEELGVKINRVSRNEMPAGHQTDKGYYNPATGEMTICMDNVTDERDAIATVLHETVGHKGLRELFGDRFREAMTNIYASLDREGREWVNAYITRHGLGFGEDGIIRGMEEYMSHLAESGNFKTSVWERIKEILGKVVDLIFGTDGFVFTDRELNYILRASYEHLKNPGWLDTPLGRAQDTLMKRELGINESDPNRPTDPDGPGTGVLFRDGGTGVASTDYNADMNMWHTSMVVENQNADLPVKFGMERILQELYGDQWEDKMKQLTDDSDYLTRHNIASSRAETEAHNFELFFFTPLLEQVREIQSRLMGGRKGKDARQLAYERTIDYMYAVSALERNAWKRAQAKELMDKELDRLKDKYDAERDAINADSRLTNTEKAESLDRADKRYQKERDKIEAKYADRDYSGITSLMGRPKEEWQEAEDDAQAMIDTFRAQIGDDAVLDELWNRIRSCTDFSLEHAYKYGLLTREEFERLHGTSSRPRLWNYYLPLRGFAEDTAEDMFDYASYMGSSDGSAKTLEKAKGRWTKADNPLAYILRIAEAEIVQGNDNWAKQALYNFVLDAGENSLLTEAEPWYVKDQSTGKWVIAEPLDVDPATGNPETLEDFEARMQALRASDPKAAKKGRRGLQLDQIMANKGNRNQHMIRLKVGGVDKRIWVNGDPAIAKAVNGWGRAKSMQWLRRAGRALSNLFTTYSIDFTAKNLIRDTIYSRVGLAMKEDKAYRHRFSKNWWSNFGYGAFAFPMVRLAAQWESGELQRKPAAARTEREQMFIDFMTDGGQTGYTIINSINKIKRRLERSMRRAGKDVSKVRIPILGHYAEFVKTLNEGFELLTRFTAYQTSRQMGRSGQRAASDAKEISVNFNRRGAQSGEGIWGNIASYLGATHYFYNAGVQGFDNFLRLFKAAPVKMSATTAGLAMMGILTPMINSMLAGALAGAGGDGDDDWYWNVPEWVRRNNIILGAGNWYIAIPLPVEFRAAYGLGDIAGAAFCYQKTPNRTFGGVAGDMLATAANILPVNPIEGYSGSGNLGDAIIRGVAPDAGMFFVDWATNRDYTGRALWKENPFNDTVPKSQGAFASTPKGIIYACQKLAQVSEGQIDIAPGLVRDFMNNYGGGFFRAAEDVSKIVTGVIGKDPDRPFRWDNIPFFSGFTGHIDEDRSNSFAQGALREYQNVSDGNVKKLNAICNTDELTAAKVYGDPEEIPEEHRARVNAWKTLHPKEYELGKMYREGMNNKYKMKQYVKGEKKGQWYKSNEIEQKGVNTLKKEWKDLREFWLSMPDNTPEDKAEKAEMALQVQEAWHLYYNAEADLADKLMDFEYGK